MSKKYKPLIPSEARNLLENSIYKCLTENKLKFNLPKEFNVRNYYEVYQSYVLSEIMTQAAARAFDKFMRSGKWKTDDYTTLESYVPEWWKEY